MQQQWRVALVLVLLLGPGAVLGKDPAYVAIVIDDLGYNLPNSWRALELPGPVAYGILPGLPDSPLLARLAWKRHKEVILHQPMTAITEQKLGPGGLTPNMTTRGIKRTLRQNLASVPHAIGISNHMGSRFTSDVRAMQRFMRVMQQLRGLFFLDSLTTPDSLGRSLAKEHGIPVISRDIFLDNEPTPEAIGTQYDKLLAIARKHGSALAIAHPYPETLDFLEQRLQTLRKGPVRLVPLVLLTRQHERNNK